MRVGNDAASAAKRHDRRIDQFRKLNNFIARINCTAADEYHRRLAVRDQRGGGLDPLGIGQRRRKTLQRFCRAGLRALGEHVPGHFQRDRAAAAREHFLEGARHQRRRGVGIFDALGPFNECSKRRELVRHLVQVAAALS